MPSGIYIRTKKITEETREKLRIANSGIRNPMYGKHTSKLQKEIVSKVMKGNKFALGKKWTEEEKLKLKGRKNGFLGKTHTKEVREKISAMRKTKIGELNFRWIKDRTKLKRESNQGERRTSAYFYWHQQVWLRDNFKCKIANPDCEGRIEAHHILGWKDYPELRYKINNGITLCHAHHPRKRAEEKRLSPYFMELVSASK